MSERIRPDYTRAITLQTILSGHASAEDALEAGAPYAALLKALECNNDKLAATAKIMCGLIPKKSPIKARNSAPIDALVRWCHNEVEPLRYTEAVGENWAYLKSLLAKDEINVLMLCGPLTRSGLPTVSIPGFRVESVVLDREDAPPSLQNILPDGFQPDATFILDIYGARIPESLYDTAGPIIFFNMDSDFQLPHQHQDLLRADLIICNSLYEHRQLTGIYPCPVLALTANTLSFDPIEFSDTNERKDFDLLHTGLSFAPIMREKAQFLFRLATIEDPALKIRFHHGFMKNDDYLAATRRAKCVPVFSARLTGGIQTRSVNALCNGAALLLGEEDPAVELFGAAFDKIHQTNAKNLEKYAASEALNSEGIRRAQSRQHDIKQALETLFHPVGGPAARILKFGLFEWARTAYQRPRNSALRTTAVSGFKDCLARARAGKDEATTYYTLAHFRAIEALIDRPFDASRRELVQTVFDEANRHGRTSLVITFNQGRYRWLLGDQQGAAAHFIAVVGSETNLNYQPTSDPLMLNLFDSASEMFPAQDYFMLLAEDITTGKNDAPSARNIILATAHTYLALWKLQSEDSYKGLEHLDEALELFADHFPAARLRFKALHSLEAPYHETAAAFNHAVACYPPVLTDLLPYAISIEINADHLDEAEALVRTWAYFITRCTWEDGKEPNIPQLTLKSVGAFYPKLPGHLQKALAERFPMDFRPS